jgi:nicotinamide N-methyltransferase
VIADFIDSDPQIVRGKRVAELGAGAGLPSLISALNGAAYVMMTDFPDADLIETVSRARPLLLM